MGRSDEILDQMKTIKLEMKHPWDDVFIIDLNEVGIWPDLKGKGLEITPQNCDKDNLSSIIFDRIAQLNPLIKNTSPFFKDNFKTTCASCFCDYYFKNRKQKNPFFINWTEFFDEMNSRVTFKNWGALPWEDSNDIIFWEKINLTKSIEIEYKKSFGNNYKIEFEKTLKEEDPAFFGKILKYKNGVNSKAS